MLCSLHIENIALLKNTDIEFDNGFTVLTGETGAGKSIIIDSVMLICGFRADRDIIRTGEEYAYVEAMFCDFSKSALNLLESMDISPDEDGYVTVNRRLTADGRSTAKINGRQVPSSRLKAIAPALIDIHGQQDTAALADREYQLGYLDGYAETEQFLAQYKKLYSEWRKLCNELDEAEKADSESNDKAEMLKFRLSELKSAKLKSGEEEKLEAERKLLANSAKITEQATAVKNALSAAVLRIHAAQSAASKLNGIIPDAEQLTERMASARYELDDICETFSSYLNDDTQDSAARLDKIESRLAELSRLQRKYKVDCEGLIDLQNTLESQLTALGSLSDRIAELKAEKAAAEQELKQAADTLTQARTEAARRLEKCTTEELAFLDMPNFTFRISITPKPFAADGADEIVYLVSANAGEDERELGKIASGGEMSRFMLALKCIGAANDVAGTMIFDEIDTGISGKTSHKTGIKLKSLAKKHGTQVICVTLSAQIAALANTHLFIKKAVSGDRTVTNVNVLDRDGRINELSRIIGGVNITDAIRSAAEEMLRGQEND